MKKTEAYSPSDLRYLQLLARQYPTVQAASTEIINLQAIMNLPKGTEHFISDIHGEYEAFLHILNSASGVVREKIDELFESTVSRADRDQLATLIYYPAEKLEELRDEIDDMSEWYRITLHRLIEVCRLATSKYTRSKVRKALPPEYAYIIDELLNTNYEVHDKKDYYENIINTIIDIDRAEIDKNVRTDHHIIGDAKQVLRMVNERIPQYDHSAWKQFVFSHRPGPEADDGQLTPRQIIQTIRRMAPGDSIVCTDVGQHQMWSIQHFHFDYPGQLITSGGFGTMGFGLGAAIGAKMGHPEKTVLLMTGDGCFRMNGQELATVSHYDIPVIVVIFNNHTLGMVHQWQNLLYGGRFSETDLNFAPDFVKLAEAYGVHGKRVTTRAELADTVREALELGHAYVIECLIDTDEPVRPMVSAGKPITEFLLE